MNDETQELTAVATAPEMEIAPLSALGQLQAEFEREVSEPRLFKRFPARGGRLAGEYKPLPAKDAKAAIKEDNDEDLLIGSLVRIMIHDPEHEAADERGLVPLGVWAGKPEEDPYRFDNRLADLLKLPHGTARQIALKLFEGNSLALATQGGEVGVWTIDTRSEVLQDFAKGS